MTRLDYIIAGAVALMAVGGWRRGFLAGALSLAGFGLGAVLGSRVGPLVLDDGSRSPYGPLFGLAGALALGALMAAVSHGVGRRLRRGLRLAVLRALDGGLGAGLAGALGLGLAWILAAVAVGIRPVLASPEARDVRRAVGRSVILRELNAILPPTGPLLNSFARLDPLPRIAGPRARLAPPRAAIARDRDVRAAAPSVVKVLGVACGLGVEGSGWVAADGLVVTNAHVVAGQRSTQVLAAGQEPGLAATVVAFDSRNDIAVLRVAGLRAPPLPTVGRIRRGTSVAVAGFPRNGPYDVRPGRIGATTTALSQDAYGHGPVRRRVVGLRATIRPGNSGGPVLDAAGRVVATIFASTTSAPRGGYAVPDSVVRRVLGRVGGPVSTGPCA